jgi:hypothetical protein
MRKLYVLIIETLLVISSACLVLLVLSVFSSTTVVDDRVYAGSSDQNKQVNKEAEISFAGEVPLIPNVRPVIILSGSDYNMGYQYYQQVVQIFGPWILRTIARDEFTDEEIANLKAFQYNIRQYTPEFIEFFKGMAAGATDAGVSLSYQEVLAAFTTTKSYPNPPAGSENEEIPPVGCSGWAAWGSTTKDGKTICCGQMEGPTQFCDTIIAFPDKGNSFIHSPVFVAGSETTVPEYAVSLRFGFWGFPGMNDKGLTFVHHGCTLSGKGHKGPSSDRFNPEDNITYGIPMGMQIVHTLRFAQNAAEALKMLTAYPRQSVFGITNGGGFWVDTIGDGFVIENVKNPFIIRRAGYVGETDFIYATNNRICKESNGIAQCQAKSYIPHAGWFEEGEKVLQAPDGRYPAQNAVERNLGIWNLLHNYHGKVDLDFAMMTWRFPAQAPVGKPNYRICNLHSAGLGIALPDNGDEGLYYVSTGTPAKTAYLPSPKSHSFRIAPTYSFYQLKLASSPEKVVISAMEDATHHLHYAYQELRKLTYWDPPYAPLDEIYNKAATEWSKGGYYQNLAQKTVGNEHVYNLSKATRAYTKCQVLAKQVCNALIPPATKPEDLGLRPWFGEWGKWAVR